MRGRPVPTLSGPTTPRSAASRAARTTSRTSVTSRVRSGEPRIRIGSPARTAAIHRASAMSGRCPSPATVNGRSTATGRPAQSSSTAALLRAYAPSGCSGSVSRDGRPAAPPYTDEDEVTTSGGPGGTVASTAAVACTLSLVRAASAAAPVSRTPGRPARWKTASAQRSASVTAGSRSSRSARSAVTPGPSGSRAAVDGDDRDPVRGQRRDQRPAEESGRAGHDD